MWIFHVRLGSHSIVPGLAGWCCGCVHHVSMGLLGFGTPFLVHRGGSHRVYPGIMTIAHEIIRILRLGETSDSSQSYWMDRESATGREWHTKHCIFQPLSGGTDTHYESQMPLLAFPVRQGG